MGFWYYQATHLMGGSEISGLSIRPVARYATVRTSVFYIVIFEKLSFPTILPLINQVTGLAC
jgi:hypothetical protein